MKKITLLFCSLFFIVDCINAQQLPLFSQYRENQSLINPATLHADYIGYNYQPNSSIGLTYRNQWAGLKDGPKTMTGRYEHVVDDYNMLFGLALISDQTGPTSTTGGYLRYAYQLEFDRYSYLSIGVAVGLLQNRFKGQEGYLRDADDVIGLSNFNTTYFDYNMGAFYSLEMNGGDKLYAGVSVPQLVNFRVSKADEDYQLSKVPHFYGQLGYYKYMGDGIGNLEGSLFLEPSIWLKYAQGAPAQMDMNLRFQMADIFWVGAGYAVALLDELQGNNFHLECGGTVLTYNDQLIKLGYGFNQSITEFGPFFGSSHEINVTYSWLR